MAPKLKDRIDYPALWQFISAQFLLGRDSYHGPAHWRRVEELGLKVAEQSGADVTVVRLFAVFHDACRENESHDPQHGPRAAKFAAQLRGTRFELDDARFDLLTLACMQHTFGKLSRDATIGTCWDADRLDLPRVGVIPRPELMSTAAGKDRKMISWALAMPRER
jgi:uncharacterized protein